MRRSATIVLFLALAIPIVPLAAACGEEGDEGASQRVEISATDFEFDPSEISVDPGEVTFELTNDGDNPHALEIEGEGVDEASDTIDPGETTELTVDLDPGTYEIYCPVGDHADRGMVGTVTVGDSDVGRGGTETDEAETETETEDDEAETETGETETGETETGETETETETETGSDYN